MKAEKDVKALDINGDARVERHEIKQMVKLSTPEADRQRAEYLAEIGKFKDMVRDCSRDRSVSSGQISIEEGMECLRKFVSFKGVYFRLPIAKLILQPQHKDVFEECDENKDGKLVKEEMKNHITRVRDRMGVNYQQPPATTPMS